MNCLTHWGLRSNPLTPERTIAGVPVQFCYGEMRLEPLVSASHLEFYFDLYNWQDEKKLKGVAPTGIQTFQIAHAEMVTIVLSGARGCGRFSLQNLLLYEIRKRAVGQLPLIVVDASVPLSSDPAASMIDFTAGLYDAFEAAGGDKAQLRAVVKDLREDYGDTPVTPEIQFGKLRAKINKLMPGAPIVYCLDAREANVTRDMAKSACNLLKPLAHYVILSMTDAKAAGHVRASFDLVQAPSVWVDAPEVDQAQFSEFLVDRLTAERQGGVPATALFPFTQGALDELFAPTSILSAGKVRFSMRYILQEVLKLVERKCNAWPAAGPPPGAFEITAQDVRDLRAQP